MILLVFDGKMKMFPILKKFIFFQSLFEIKEFPEIFERNKDENFLKTITQSISLQREGRFNFNMLKKK